MTTYTYTLSQFTNVATLNTSVNPQRLANEIQSNVSLVLKFLYISQVNINVIFTFSSALTAGEILLLNAIVAAHPNNSVKPPSTFSTNPTVNDDESNGYFAGDLWINYSTKDVWRCVNGYKGAAEWLKVVKSIGDFSDVSISSPATGNLLPFGGTNWNNATPLNVNFNAYKNMKYVNTTILQTQTRNNNQSAFFQIANLSMNTSNTLNKTLDYYIAFLSGITCDTNNVQLDVEIRVNGTAITNSLKTIIIDIATHIVVMPVKGIQNAIPSGQAITVFARKLPNGSGAVTFTFRNSSLFIFGC